MTYKAVLQDKGGRKLGLADGEVDNHGIFATELTRFLNHFEKFQNDYFAKKIKGNKKHGALIADFYESLLEFQTGGKKLRPLLVYLGYKLAGGVNIKKILPITMAVELVHSFLLIHDDIIDRSSLRRGRQTVHVKFSKRYGEHFGSSVAIVLGDITCFEAFKIIAESDLDAETKVRVSSRFSQVLLETGYGEALDVENSYSRPSYDEIVNVTDLKTARYSFVGPLLLGVLVTGKSGGVLLAKLEEFGLAIGFAFQLKDDILGLFGQESVIGKSITSDIREGKNTLLIYKSRKLASVGDNRVLDKLWGKKNATTSDLERVRKIVEGSGALAWAENESLKMVEKAKKVIWEITKNDDMRQLFGELCDFVVERRN